MILLLMIHPAICLIHISYPWIAEFGFIMIHGSLIQRGGIGPPLILGSERLKHGIDIDIIYFVSEEMNVFYLKLVSSIIQLLF